MEVKIRPLEPEDAYISVKWRNNPEVSLASFKIC